MQAVFASGKTVAVEAGQANEDDRSAIEVVAAGVCRSDVLASYRRQSDLLEQQIQQEKQKKEQALAAQRSTTLTLITREILIGFVLTAVLALIFSDVALMVVVVGVVVMAIAGVWTYRRGSARGNTISVSYDQNIASRQQSMDRLTPEAQCRVGQIWWALQVVRQSRRDVMLLDVARKVEVVPVSVVTEPSERQDEPRSFADPDEALVEKLPKLLVGFKQLAEHAQSWAVMPARLPIVVKDFPMEESFCREITALLESQPVQPAPADLPILLSDASLMLLQDGLIAPADAWETCCRNAAGWTAYFKGLSTRALGLRKEVLEVFRQNCEDWLTTETCPTPPSSIWTNLSTQRPDISGIRQHLEAEREQAVHDLEGGIDHEQRQKLLDDLRQVMGEAYRRPWPDKWHSQVDDLKQRYQAMTEQLQAVGAGLRELSGGVDRLRSQYEVLSNKGLDEQLGQVHTNLQQARWDIDRLRGEYARMVDQLSRRIDTDNSLVTTDDRRKRRPPVSPAVGQPSSTVTTSISSEIERDLADLRQRLRSELTTLHSLTPQVSSAHSRSEQLATTLSGSDTMIRGIGTSLAGLNQSSRDVVNAFTSFERRIDQPLGELRRLAGQMERTLVTVEEDLKHHSEAVARYEEKIRAIEDEYTRQVREARDEALARKKASEDAQKMLSWLTARPEAVVSGLAGVEASSIEALGQYHASNNIQDLVRSRIQAVVDQGFENVSNLCTLRMEFIETAYQWAHQALNLTTSQTNDVDVILIPVWYVEWNETTDPEQPQAQQVRYRLTTPIQTTRSGDGITQAAPMYPAIQQYIKSVSLPGEWEGAFAPDHPARLAKGVRQSIPLREVLVRFQVTRGSTPSRHAVEISPANHENNSAQITKSEA